MNQEYLKGIHSEMCRREAIIFQATENNIISFLKNSLFAERSEIRTLAVSYTHLDVYKRQTLSAGETINIIDNDGMAFYVPGGAKISFYISLKTSGSVAVSYTHLDVYKRQSLTYRLPHDVPQFQLSLV